MSILSVIIVLIIVGVGLWFIETYLPMNAGVKRLLEAVIVLVLLIWLLSVVFNLGNLRV